MNHSLTRRLAAIASACLLGLLSAAHAAAVLSYEITVNTADLAGQSGQLDMQFNPSVGTAPGAQAIVSAFTSGGALTGAATLDGNATGDLATSVTFANSTTFNALLQNFTFGSAFSFVLTFSGDFLTAPNLDATGFSLSLLDDAFAPLASNDASGRILSFELADGGAIFADLGTPVGQTPRLTVRDAPAPAPLPASVWLLAVGALALTRVRQ